MLCNDSQQDLSLARRKLSLSC